MTFSLQELSDRQEIQELLAAYSYAIDFRDWDALDDVFTEDATIDYTEAVNVRGTLPEIKAFLARSLTGFLSIQHAVSTSRIVFEGDTAKGRTICFNPVVIDQGNGQTHVLFAGLWYRDTFVRTARGWRIRTRYEEKSFLHNVPPGFVPGASPTVPGAAAAAGSKA
ncbi:MAG TPA: nuclear transport factor 2 family protein [Steroidobacteraceae bacterium]|nr:nuclear transport factor 2 family protein [Steroidobacteraceae bacterium]